MIMSHPVGKLVSGIAALCMILGTLSTSGCNRPQATTVSGSDAIAMDGPSDQGPPLLREDGDATLGREVFRFETFGNEGFWTDAARLPAGIAAAMVSPLHALQLGLQIDVDAIDRQTREALAVQLRADPTGKTSSILNDPAVTPVLVKANAIVGMSAKGEKVGTSCALCHTMTDASTFRVPEGGSIGHRVDGLANHSLNLGAILATANNSRAFYPLLQLSLRANKGKSLGRAPAGLTETSTEAEVDAYLGNPAYYPIGMFDDTFDGNGDPMHNSPLFRQDLAAPYGSEGTIARLDNFSNLVYTSLFDLTMLTTPGGRAFLHTLGGAAGDEIADNYVKVLAATGVRGYPYVHTSPHPKPGSEDAPIGVRVDNTRLLALNAYLATLPAPAGARVARDVAARGRQTFRVAGCTGCHNVDQGKPVPTTMHAMKEIFPGDAPVVLAQREPPLNPVMNTEASIFDDKMAVVNASLRGEKRGLAMPLLLDLARKPVFLHDNSVPTLSALLDPSRGPMAPHPFYLADPKQREEMVQYLRGLDTRSRD
jgi:cytochrome c2